MLEVLQKERPAVGYAIAVFILAGAVFTFIWAVVDYAIYPQLQQFQLNWVPNSINSDMITFMNNLVLWFPFAVIWSLVFYLFNEAQRKFGPQDYPA